MSDFEPVVSSYIKGISYNEGTEELRVQFKSGVTWRYFDIPPKLHVSLLLAESTGKFFAKEIKGVYTGRKVEEDEE